MQPHPAGTAKGVSTSCSDVRLLRTLSTLAAGALAALILLVTAAATSAPPERHPGISRWIVVSDTDSVDVETSLTDTTVVLDSLWRAERYAPMRRPDPWTSSPVPRRRRAFLPRIGNYWRHEVTLDSVGNSFTIREFVGETPVRYPLRLSYEEYQRHRIKADMHRGWREAINQRQQLQRAQRRSGLGLSIVVPGGSQSAFTTIFGRDEIDLRVVGQADIRAGFDYRSSDQQVALTGRPTRLDPDFKQDLRLGIAGTIGDKLRVDVNWDTQSQFEFQNRLRLQYEGYEDEIIQRVEAGNVFLSTPSRLIRGGQSLFGILSQFQLGGLTMTTVASQQEGQSNSLSIEGGSESTEFELRPTDYDDNTHYFLGYYFRNRWETALSQPPNVIVANGFERITDVEVWKLMPTSPEEQDVRQIVAVVDLGEPQELVTLANEYTRDDAGALPGADVDQYDDQVLEAQLRDGNATPRAYLTTEAGLSDDDFQLGRFRRLVQGRDYVLDDVLGYISLNARLQESEALAVAFRYVANGRVHTVGDFSGETGGSTGGQNERRLVLKLLKPVQLRQPAPEQGFNPAAWYLELRNIYRMPGRNINPTDFELQIEHQPPGRPASRTIPEIAGRTTLLQLLGFDRLNADGAVRPDDRFDYLPNFTIDPAQGKLIFPYLQPFGNRIRDVIEANASSEQDIEPRISEYVFQALYTQKKEMARRETRYDVYRIRGSYRGAVQEFYDLRAFSGLIEGSVRVTSGGSRLTEGADYVVDYQGGTVQITNPAFLTAGRDVEITYEQNSFFNIQKKTLLGARADYDLGTNVRLGGTVFNLNQKSPIDKFRIGEEPVSNTIWGVDGRVENWQPDWLTRAIDALPFIQTRAPSTITLSGEFAQLRPGAGETVAFERSRRMLRDRGLDFKSDELTGISYLDDFEGFENTYSLRQPGAWHIASAPDSIGRYPGIMQGMRFDSLRTNWRGSLAWYMLNQNIVDELVNRGNAPYFDGEAIATVHINRVFPSRDTRGESHPFIQTLDVYYSPHMRGPYNYTRDLRSFINTPKDTWGAMIQRIPDGYTDFGLRNIEFIEFIFRPFPENERRDAGPDAKLYIDVGSISEDVIPNGRLNTEDGLTLNTVSQADLDPWGRTSRGTQNNTVDVDMTAGTRGRTQDLGLDGLASYDPDAYDPLMTEQHHFRDFLESLDPNDPDPLYRAEVARSMRDPSGDDYLYFGSSLFDNTELYPGRATVQQRFSRYFTGHELNSFEAQNKLAPQEFGRRGNSRMPDTEDLNMNSALDTDNSYFQYEVPLSRAALDSLAARQRVQGVAVTEISDADGVGTGWYQVRIPIRDYARRVGNIQDFTLIEALRLWTTGHEVPITLRFATFELVGSQWQQSTAITMERELPSDTLANDTRLSITSINNEEHGDTYRSPPGTIISQHRLTTGVAQLAREQAMVLRVERLMPGKQRAVFRTYSQGMDLLKYSNLRMFSHMHGWTADGLPIESRDKVRLFLRLGANESNDYYEYELPLTPSSPHSGDADALWQTNQFINGELVDLNSVNILLGALNQLKVSRDERAFPADSVYWSDVHNVPLNPALEQFAPPGTRLGIRGTPSLGRVNAIVIGVRNAADSTVAGAPNRRAEDILDEVTIWVNELRVSGYDETNGWAALANADVRLADLGTIRANWQLQSDGFGGLESTLGEREQRSLNNWSVTTDLNLDKFIPERYGWSIPVSMQVQTNTATPRFAPNRGDIRLEELLSQVDGDDSLTEAERAIRRQEAIESAQTRTHTRSYNARLQKSGSSSSILRSTLDGISLNYSFSESEARNPSQRINDRWNWTSTVNYRLINRARTVRPFWFLQPIPLFGILGDLQFNYIPQSITTSATAARNFSETRDRPRGLPVQDLLPMPDAVEFPLRQQHALSHRRTFNMQYNPFQFLNLSFDANTNQSLNALAVDTLFSVVVMDPNGVETLFPNLNMAQAISQGVVADSLANVTAFEVDELRIVPTGKVINRIFSGHDGLRTERHGSRLSGNFRPNLSRYQFLNWITLQDVVYESQFNWQNGSVGRNTGASVNNQLGIRGGVTLRLQELFRKVPLYASLEEAQRTHDQERAAERQRREQERERSRQEREQLERLRQEAIEEGEDPDEVVPENGGQETTADDGGGFRLPLPNPANVARRVVLAVTGIRDLTVQYNANRSSNSSNVGMPIFQEDAIVGVESSYGLLDALRGHGPSLGYRLGLERRVGLDQRVLDPTLQVTDVLQNGNQIQARTSLNPSPSLQINLTWTANWDTGSNFTFRPTPGGAVDMTTTTTGTNRASVWAFNANYLDLFARQLETFEQDLVSADDPTDFGDANRDGRVVLTNRSVVEDFTNSFLTGLGTVDHRGLLPFPMPNWQVQYTGLARWPIIRSLVSTANVRHGYSSDYSTDYRQNPFSADSMRTFDLAGKRISFVVPSEEVGGVRLNQRYQPLIGFDLGFRDLQANILFNKSTSYSLSTSNFEVAHSETNEVSVTTSYQRTGLSLPILGGRLNNRINLSLTISRSSIRDQRLSLRRGLADRIERGDEFQLEDAVSGDNVSLITASTRFTLVPRVSYQFSNRVSADFTLRYENFESQDSRQPSVTTVNGGFNIRVHIAN